MFIEGSPYDGSALGPLFMRAHVRVKIGEPMDLSPYFGREKEEGVTQEITKRLLLEIARLAGHPEFEPQLAGRRWKTGEGEADGGNGNGGNNSPAANADSPQDFHGNGSADAPAAPEKLSD